MAAFPRLPDASKVVPWAAQLVRELTRSVKYTAFGSATLQAGTSQTLVSSSAVRLGSQVFIVPITASAAAEVATTFISAIQDGSFIITHESNAVDDRAFNFVIFEPAPGSSSQVSKTVGGPITNPGSPGSPNIGSSQVDLTGAADSRAALQTFFNGLPDGSTVIIPPNSIIKLSGLVTVTNKTLFLEWGNCRINASGAVSLFSFKSDYEAVQSVSSISNSRDVTVANGGAYVVGDVLKILSDDLDGFGAPANIRQGEWVSVASIAGNVLTLTSDLENAYTTGIRIARPSVKTLKWKGGIIDYPGIASSPTDEEAVTVNGYSNPIIEGLKVKRGFGTGIEFIGCVNGEVRNCDIRNLDDKDVDTSSPNSFGYGVASGSSLRTKVEDNLFGNVRHGFTTRPRSTTAGDSEVEKYGHDESALVKGNACIGSKNTSFDTHHATRRTQFVSNEAFNCKASGYGLRGIDISLRGNVSNKCEVDIKSFVQSGVAATGTNLVRVFDHTSINSGRVDADTDMLLQDYRARGGFSEQAGPTNSDIEVFRLGDDATLELHGSISIDLNDPESANFEYIRTVDGTIINYGTLTFNTKAGTNTGTASLIDRQASGSYFMGKTRITGPGLARIIRDAGETYDPDLMFGTFVIDDGGSIALSSDDGDADLIGGATLTQFTAALTAGVWP